MTGRIPTFIKLAETKIYRDLRTRENEFNKVWTQADAILNPIELPRNFREIKMLNLNGLPLENISPTEFRARQWKGSVGETSFFTQIERNLYLLPWPEVAPDPWPEFTLELIYYGTESVVEMATWDTPTVPNDPPIGPNGETLGPVGLDQNATRLLLVAPDLYLYGAIAEAYRFLREPEKTMEYMALFETAKAELQMEQANSDLTGSVTGIASVYYDGRY